MFTNSSERMRVEDNNFQKNEYLGGRWGGEIEGEGKRQKVCSDQNTSDQTQWFDFLNCISLSIYFAHCHSKVFSWMFVSDLEFWLKESFGKSLSRTSLQLSESESLIIGHVWGLLDEISNCGYDTRLAKNQHTVAIKSPIVNCFFGIWL